MEEFMKLFGFLDVNLMFFTSMIEKDGVIYRG